MADPQSETLFERIPSQSMALVVLAMSGGVDSSVAAKLLLDAGHQVVGIFLRHGIQDAACKTDSASAREHEIAVRRHELMAASPLLPIVNDQRLGSKQGCCTSQDAEDARRIAGKFQVPFYALDLNQEFGRIMDYFVDEYVHGRTPNPCIMCNHHIKFGHLFEYANSIGADCVATGHYARRVVSSTGEPQLWRGIDADKDQAYVLFGIRRNDLGRVELPVGGFRKTQIRAMATHWNLRVASKKDSQEICFVDAGKHAEFVASRSAGDRRGEIVDTQGNVVGRHLGIEKFTIGQRKGLGVAFGEPMFVVRIEPESRRVVVGKRSELKRQTLTAKAANWLCDPPQRSFSALVQIRYNGRAYPATVTPNGDDRFAVDFDEPCEAVAPGQAAVCFLEQRLLGGGWIDS